MHTATPQEQVTSEAWTRELYSQALEQILDRDRLPPPGLPQAVPEVSAPDSWKPSLLLVGESLSAQQSQRLLNRGFRSVLDVEGLPEALHALAHRRYDVVSIFDHVHPQCLRFCRSIMSWQDSAPSPLLEAVVSRCKTTPFVVLQSTVGGYTIFRTAQEWYLSPRRGPHWSQAVRVLRPTADQT